MFGSMGIHLGCNAIMESFWSNNSGRFLILAMDPSIYFPYTSFGLMCPGCFFVTGCFEIEESGPCTAIY